jgi:acetate kinase
VSAAQRPPVDRDLTRVLVLNCGSSSVKAALVDPVTADRTLTVLAERVGSSDVVLRLHRGTDETSVRPDGSTHAHVVDAILSALTDEERAEVTGVGHRVVHGGRRFTASVRVDDDVVAGLTELTDLAPLHLPANVAGIAAARARLPQLPHAAVFDTAFHQTMPPVAYRYAVPTEWYERHHVRRYGFHGISHRYVAARAAELLDRPLASLAMVTLHLGNGCSAAAIRGGESVDTTMGLTPLEGLVMGTRSGDIDPGVLGYLAGRLGLDLPALLDTLNTRSGLLGLSGLSNDMRTIAAAAHDGSKDAALAIEIFCYRAAKSVGALAVALGRLDAVVFTGGMGEKGTAVRSAILGHLDVLGLREDPAANGEHGVDRGGRVSSADSSVVALVVATDEELVIARDTAELAR